MGLALDAGHVLGSYELDLGHIRGLHWQLVWLLEELELLIAIVAGVAGVVAYCCWCPWELVGCLKEHPV